MNRDREKAEFKEQLEKIIHEFDTPALTRAPFVGAEPGEPLEHVTRQHFINQFLSALGWDLTRFDEQMIEEARTRGETTLRLDYLGVTPDTRVPLMIVEAKGWGKPFIAVSTKGAALGTSVASSPMALLCAAIEHCKAGGTPEDSPVLLEWAKGIAKLHQYVMTLKAESGHIVRRLAITSGKWLIAFSDPEATFIYSGNVSSQLISIFNGDLLPRSDEIFNLMARRAIDDSPPPRVRPTLLHAYSRAGDVAQVFRALWVSRRTSGSHWDAHPQLNLYVAIIVQRRDGALLTVVDEAMPRQPLPHDYAVIRDHIAQLNASADSLLGKINSELGTTLVPSRIENFPGFPAAGGVTSEFVAGGETLVYVRKSFQQPGEFLLVTGADPHFILAEPTVSPCGFHDWSFCHDKHQHQGAAAVVARSVTPKSFFTTGEAHHCAHRTV